MVASASRQGLAIPTAVMRCLVLVVAYYATARLGLQVQLETTQATPIWPPSGIALAALLIFGPRMSVGVFIGAFLANLTDFYAKADAGAPFAAAPLIQHFLDNPAEIGLSAAVGLGNTAEAIIGWGVLRAFRIGSDITHRAMSVLIFVSAALAGCVVAATIGIGSLFLAGYIAPPLALPAWLTWLLGDSSGIVILTPFLLTWLTLDARKLRALPWRPMIAALALLSFAAGTIFIGWLGLPDIYRQGFLIIPILLWIAVAFGDAAATLGIVVVASIAIAGTLSGAGPFFSDGRNESLIVLQEFIAVVSLTLLVTTAVLRGRQSALDAMRSARDQLDQRVKERSAALRASELRHRVLVDAVADHAIFILTPEGRIATWNSGAERLGGYKAEEVLGRHFSMLYTEEDRAAQIPEQDLRSAARDGKHEVTAWRLRKDGSRFMADIVLHAMRDETGRLTGFGRVTRDITRRYQLAQELEKTRESLAQAQKLEAVGKLTGGIAHDFNNLLSVISGNLDLLERQVSSATGKRMIDALHRAADRAAKLTQSLLAFSRRQPLRPETVNTNRLINEFGELLRRAVGDAAALELVLSPTLDPVHIDPAQFQSAVLNLVLNARDAIQKSDGKIVVRTENVVFDAGQPPTLNEMPPGHYAAIHVEDNGDGIPADVLEHVFEPFFTTKEVGKGSGLGLAQVYGFITQSGGHVRLDSRPGLGTRVSLYLPRASGRGEAAEISTERAPPLDQPDAARILVVEDDADLREVVASKIAEMGYETVLASDGPSALKILQSGAPIDLLFSDVVMPNGLRGDELARRAQMLRPGLQVLLTSGYPTAQLDESQALRDFPLLTKPYRTEELARAIAERLAR